MSRPEWPLRLVTARERLVVAQENLDNGHVRDAVNRAYYAMHGAAQALLRERGVTAKTHRGIGHALTELARAQHDVTLEDVSSFLAAMRVREEGDYEVIFHVDAIGAQEFIKQATAFVDKIALLLQD